MTASRLNLSRAAIRPEMKGRVMLSGPPGAGKTYTGLIVATALVGPDGKILVLDTEKESSLTYADLFKFDHLRWNPPFDPNSLALTLREAQNVYDCIIIDSFSHFWRKQGGVLDIAGGVHSGWKEARPIQENLIETILDIDAHVIVCCRSKMDHLVETDERGKLKITKMGLKAQQDDDLEYEVNVALEIDMGHVIHVAKSRTNAVPVATQFQAGYAGDFAMIYRDWLQSGEPVADKADTDALAEALNRIEDESSRKRAKYEFLDTFGRPEFLLVSRLPEAKSWVADRLLGIAPPVDRAEDSEPDRDTTHDEAPDDADPGPGAEAKPKPDLDKEGLPEPPAGGGAQGAAPSPGSDPPDDPAPGGEGAQGAGSDAPEPEADPDPYAEARVRITGEVATLSVHRVQEELATAELSANGSPKRLRERLVKYRVEVEAAAEV